MVRNIYNKSSCFIYYLLSDTLSTSPTIPVPGYTDISFNSVTLSWNPSTEQCIDHYNITVTRNNMNPVDMISDTTSYVYPIDRGVEYCFIVSVVDGANRRGPDSMSRCLTAEGNFSLFLHFHYIILIIQYQKYLI